MADQKQDGEGGSLYHPARKPGRRPPWSTSIYVSILLYNKILQRRCAVCRVASCSRHCSVSSVQPFSIVIPLERECCVVVALTKISNGLGPIPPPCQVSGSEDCDQSGVGLGIRSSPARLVWSTGCSPGVISAHLGRPDRFGPRACRLREKGFGDGQAPPRRGERGLEEERNCSRFANPHQPIL